MHPAGSHNDWQENITEVDNGQATPGSGLCWWRCGIATKLQPENPTLFILSTICRVKWRQGPPQGSVGAVLEQLEGRNMSFAQDKHCQCAD
jgi:hypothetical protein